MSKRLSKAWMAWGLVEYQRPGKVREPNTSLTRTKLVDEYLILDLGSQEKPTGIDISRNSSWPFSLLSTYLSR